ncbi:MAG: dephospho-CoA kinase [Actinomycetota bacterium]
MLLVGLTGGIASGKSTVSCLLAEKGAEIVDADRIARQVVMPGTRAWSKIVDHFGKDVLFEDGSIDRAALADRVFGERAKLSLLNEITHPEIMKAIAERLEILAGRDEVVVLDAPLLVDLGAGAACDLVVVVTAEADRQVERLERDRGMESGQARSRIASQIDARQREDAADIVIHNDGTLEELQAKVEALWCGLQARLAARRRETT